MLKKWKNLFGRKEKHDIKEAEVEAVDVRGEAKVSNAVSMVPKVIGDGVSVNYEHGGYYDTKRVLWVSKDTDENGNPLFVRAPEEKTKAFPAMLPFQAAGKLYHGLSQFCDESV